METLKQEELRDKARELFNDWKKVVGRKLCELDELWMCVEDAEAEVANLRTKILAIVNENKLPLMVNSILVKVHKVAPKLKDDSMSGTYNWEFTLTALPTEYRRLVDPVDVTFESIPSPIDNAVNDTYVVSSVYENKFDGQLLRNITVVEFDELEAEFNLF